MSGEPPCYSYYEDHECDADDEITPEYDERRDFITDADYEIMRDDSLSMRDIESYKRLVIFCNRKQQKENHN